MPELPEVESIRRCLLEPLRGQEVVEVWRSQERLRVGAAWRDESLDLVRRTRITELTRRGKYLLIHLETLARPNDPRVLVVHLGMSGQLLLAEPEDARPAHTHAVFSLFAGRELRFVDPRRFGALKAGPWPSLGASSPLADLGPEPLSEAFDALYLHGRLRTRRVPVYDLLLDQSVVAGIGNIYAVEALFEAGCAPLRPGERVTEAEAGILVTAVKTVLERGLAAGGTTLRDFRDPYGRPGRNQQRLRAYGRTGEACERCGASLAAFERGGRRGTYCPTHQTLRSRPRSGSARANPRGDRSGA